MGTRAEQPLAQCEVTLRGTAPRSRRGPPAVVVHLRGEHDLATRSELAEVMAQAISLGSSDVVIDLRRVEFMDAATVGVITRAQALLRARSRALTVKEPSPCARRVLQLCDLTHLIVGPEERPDEVVELKGCSS